MMIRLIWRNKNVTNRLVHRGFHNARFLNNKKPGLTEQEFDDAELMSDRLNSKPYYAKRSNEDRYESQSEVDDKGFQKETPLTPEQIKKQNEKIEGLKGIVQGLLVLGAMFGGFQLYQKYPVIRNWWYKQDGDEFVIPQKKKQTSELPNLNNKNDSSIPGLYIWGNNFKGLIDSQPFSSNHKFPTRHSWFDGKFLKDVFIGDESAVAIDSNGDLIQWGQGFNPVEVPSNVTKKNWKGWNEPQYTIKGQGLKYAKISNGVVYALNKHNEIIYFPENLQKQLEFKGDSKRNWLLRSKDQHFTKLTVENGKFNKGEFIQDFQTGKVHLVALTNQGRAFTSSTGLTQTTKESKESKGQFGLIEYSHFKSSPPVNKLYEIYLLNNEIVKNSKGKIDHIESRKIQQVATGNYHTIALDSNGEVHTFGDNTFGQLGHPVNYDTQFITIPKKISLFNKHVARDYYPECIEVYAGGDTSFVKISPIKMFQMVKKSGTAKIQEQFEDLKNDDFILGFGNNLKGQIGNGHYVHAQFEPFKIKELLKFNEFNESTGKLEKIGIKTWSSGYDHTFIKLENNDVLYWGGNDFGELGNGKKNRISKPSIPSALIEPGFNEKTFKDPNFVNRLQLSSNQKIIASSNASAIYYTKP
ncbi:hypothetical protein BN7_1989 [Wickerhamomyces ciferrii]|uniref:Protein FMP25, mitochondrial n=1 Tax=Wickerhamomyces ciferrii (strain ATCC 14091 / BCRC 22168 / CBS 111 / JCM 3599 / NBRC 0793 / NRRL Y-1031 F-60-10) TaxID=1206466 RepID=K0KM40_WICCF|nr:uncharacterized protein BN7_1989 [Wickerhamomyces ciferrii]CCH42444.1 hypothetical protein BN7_1989 [Wickerhamomyces ciferrii]